LDGLCRIGVFQGRAKGVVDVQFLGIVSIHSRQHIDNEW
jgi:hypothetical protein